MVSVVDDNDDYKEFSLNILLNKENDDDVNDDDG